MSCLISTCCPESLQKGCLQQSLLVVLWCQVCAQSCSKLARKRERELIAEQLWRQKRWERELVPLNDQQLQGRQSAW